MISDLKDISLNGASLEPIDGDADQNIPKGPAKFTANTRGKVERRQTEDRRTELRFQDNRRSSKDRRPASRRGASTRCRSSGGT